MRSSTIYPHNDLVPPIEENVSHENIDPHRRKSLTPTRRDLRFYGIISVVAFVLICAVAIPLSITLTRNKNNSQTTTITEHSTSLETTAPTTVKAIARAESTSGMAITSTMSITELTNSSSGLQSKASISTPLTKDVNVVPETTSVSPSTGTSSIDNGSTTKNSNFPSWTSNMKATVTSIAETTRTKSTTASATSNPTTITVRPMIVLTQVTDIIVGLYNTTAGGPICGWNGRYPQPGEMPHHAIDNSTESKYLNFGGENCSGCTAYRPGLGTGFLVIPSLSNATIACGLRFSTADDNSARDPITVTLEGSNGSNITALNQGFSWTLIYNGSTGINATNDHDRKTYGTQQIFSNTKPFASYRLLVTSKRGNSNSVQYSEVQIMGYV